MITISYKIKDPVGIHARPAGLLAKEAAKYNSKITLQKDGKEADIRQLLGVMSLGIKQGEEIQIVVEGEDEIKAKEAIEKFLQENL